MRTMKFWSQRKLRILLNVIEGQLDMQKLSVPVRAYAIQAAYAGGSGETVAEQARAAYEKYVNQNREQEGQTTT